MIRLATASASLAPPTCSSARLPSWARTEASASAACNQRETAGGTSEQRLTPWRAISGKQLMGPGSGASTTAPPASNTPRAPGELRGKLWGAGRAQR
ncbi:hypothetical protein D3C76_1148780 [compost metagenome]